MSTEQAFRRVTDLGPGAVFLWCDRRVTITAPVEHRPWGILPAVYLTVREDDGTERRLHYYADERVPLP